MHLSAEHTVVRTMTKIACAIATLCLCLLTASTSRADTVRFAGAEVQTPDDGWVARTDSGMMILGPEKGGAVVELYNFSKVPAADKAALEKLVGGRKNTTNVSVSGVTASHSQNSLSGIAFRGTATIVGKPTSFRAVAFGGINNRAIVVIAFIRSDANSALQRDVGNVITSVRRAP